MWWPRPKRSCPCESARSVDVPPVWSAAWWPPEKLERGRLPRYRAGDFWNEGDSQGNRLGPCLAAGSIQGPTSSGGSRSRLTFSRIAVRGTFREHWRPHGPAVAAIGCFYWLFWRGRGGPDRPRRAQAGAGGRRRAKAGQIGRGGQRKSPATRSAAGLVSSRAAGAAWRTTRTPAGRELGPPSGLHGFHQQRRRQWRRPIEPAGRPLPWPPARGRAPRASNRNQRRQIGAARRQIGRTNGPA